MSAAPAKRTRGKPFTPGKSGNPGGRPKGSSIVRELARKHTDRAIEIIAAAMDSADEKVALQAAGMMLDRAWGKPATEIDVYFTVLRELEGKSDEELEEIAARGKK